MIGDKRVVIVMPAYNAARTIERTHGEVMDQGVADLVVVVDDHSGDGTVEIASRLENVLVHRHSENRGYGANQKTCFDLALENGADIVVMIHPDYQYTPKLLGPMASLVACGLYKCVLGSRILGGKALEGGMPLYKYVSNRFLTLVENAITGAKLSEYHTGYRAYAADLLRRIPYHENSDDFIFDNQILAQVLLLDTTIGEISCPASYFPEASSINFQRSLKYGLGCLATAATFRMVKWGLSSPPGFLDLARPVKSSP